MKVKALGAALALTVAGCTPREPARAPLEMTSAGEKASFRIDKTDLRRKGGNRLVARLEESPYHYFRFLARPFELRTCNEMRNFLGKIPVVAVHGDAHVEQFVVTHDTYGLEDFDQSGYGPSVVDLVRYASSIELACREAKYPCSGQKVIDRYFAAYRDAVDKTVVRDRMPSITDRLRAKAPQDRGAWLAWVDTQMVPIPPATNAMIERSWKAFRDLQRTVHPERPDEFYDVVRLGELKMGIGSALEEKMLLRVRGATADPLDDVVLEARSGETMESSSCVWRPSHGFALHVLLFMTFLGTRMPDVIGFVSFDRAPDNQPFWVQSWSPGYVELSLDDLRSQAELEELVLDAARQLGGHSWTMFPEQVRAYMRVAQLQAFDAVRPHALALARSLAQEVVDEHAHFKAQK